jgi:hypothetical protein
VTLKLNNLSVSPPGGWFYRVPETGKTFKGYPSPEGLRKALAAHCAVHNLPVPGDAQIQDFICKNLGEEAIHWCVDRESGEAQAAYLAGGVACRLTFSQVMAGTRTLLSWLISSVLKLKWQRVEGAEAERRARICAPCPECQEVQGCSSCSMPALRQLIQSAVQGGTTTQDTYLTKRGCCKCGCASLPLIWMPLETLQKHMSEAVNTQLPTHCWKKRTSLP